jgi:inosose dehydratase
VSFVDRIAAAPISWGVCEVPGWGAQMPVGRVLGEMLELGLSATEAGPEGYLGADPDAVARTLEHYRMRLIGGFVPAALHVAGGVAAVERAAQLFGGLGADVLVVAASAETDGYDERPQLSPAEWDALFAGLDAAQDACARRGLRCALHPHAGTVVERREEVERVLERSRVELCLDTGHLMIGGVDPLALVRDAGERVSHVHLKDVDAPLATRVLAGELTYSDAVRAGLYRPLGGGSLDVAAFVGALEQRGYDGWYVLEHDHMLTSVPPPGDGPIADARASLATLTTILEENQ